MMFRNYLKSEELAIEKPLEHLDKETNFPLPVANN